MKYLPPVLVVVGFVALIAAAAALGWPAAAAVFGLGAVGFGLFVDFE